MIGEEVQFCCDATNIFYCQKMKLASIKRKQSKYILTWQHRIEELRLKQQAMPVTLFFKAKQTREIHN